MAPSRNWFLLRAAKRIFFAAASRVRKLRTLSRAPALRPRLTAGTAPLNGIFSRLA
jgi:hypothetical protein